MNGNIYRLIESQKKLLLQEKTDEVYKIYCNVDCEQYSMWDTGTISFRNRNRKIATPGHRLGPTNWRTHDRITSPGSFRATIQVR